jgi:hypothetical protein
MNHDMRQGVDALPVIIHIHVGSARFLAELMKLCLK